MNDKKTKVILERTFTKVAHALWECKTTAGVLTLTDYGHVGSPMRWAAILEGELSTDMRYAIATGEGNTEEEAILALQSKLIKMLALEPIVC